MNLKREEDMPKPIKKFKKKIKLMITKYISFNLYSIYHTFFNMTNSNFLFLVTSISGNFQYCLNNLVWFIKDL